MAELLLTQAVNQAEQAIETGNYGGAIETCQRILGAFPEFARAHRIMAEAYAEQGDSESARHAYQRTLERDPQSIAAHLGLAMIAEEAGEQEAALAHFQVAWEIDPRRRDLREHVSRLSQQVYGDDGRLYLTRAALASLHFHAGRWDRAVSEAAQVLHELTQRVDVQVRMAEALWRRGDDEQAKQVCTSILRTLPSAVVPLLILADIHRRQGNEGVAQEMLEQARAIDPDGVRAADLIIVGLDDQADFLSVENVPTIEERILTEEPAARYAPAPDFIGEDEEPSPVSEDVAGSAETSQEQPAASEAAGQDTEFTPGPDIQPFRWEDIGDEDLEASDLETEPGQSLDDLAGVMGEDATPEPTPEEEESISLDLFTDEEIEQARPSDEQPAGYTGMLQSLDSEGVQPFDPTGSFEDFAGQLWREEPEEEVIDEMSADPFQPEEVSDTAPEVSGEAEQEPVVEAEEPAPADIDPFDVDWTRVDEEIEQARPGDTPRGYTDEFRGLEDIGVEPFSLEEEPPETAAEPAETGEMTDVPDLGRAAEEQDVAEPGDVEAEDVDLDALTQGWELPPEEPAERSEAETEFLQSPSDEDVAQEERSGALESLDDLFGEYGAEAFQEEAESPGPADIAPFDVSEFSEEPAATAPEEPEFGPETELPEVPFEPAVPEEQAEAPEMSAAYDLTLEAPEPPTAEAVSEGTPPTFEVSAERLGFGQELVDRARQAKQELIDRGLIDGNLSITGDGVSLEQLREAVQQDLENVDARVALAAALMDEYPDEALEQYRWLYRNAPEHGVEIVDDLARLIKVMHEREGGVHRLLAAVYRRHGDWRLAATHYEESLMLSRRHVR